MLPTYSQDALASRIRMVTNKDTSKNPLAFTDPTDRMAATLAKAQRIVNSAWYKKLPPRFQNLTKQAYYESYVVPAYSGIVTDTDALTKSVSPYPADLIEPGNIDLYNRPRTHNPDGTSSTVRSIGITDDKGRNIVIPTVMPDGKIVSNKEAIAWYNKTHQQLGIFKSQASADKFAEQLHLDYAAGKYDKLPTKQLPGYSKLPIPDKDTWINNIERAKNINPAQYYEADGWRNYDQFGYHELGTIGSIFRGMSNAGIWLDKEASLGKLGLATIFAAPFDHGELVKNFKEVEEGLGPDITNQQIQKTVSNISNTIFGNIDFWNQVNPSRTIGDKISNITGEVIGSLPLYEAFSAAGESMVGTTSEAGNLTKALNLSDKGQFVARRLNDAASGYLTSLLQNNSTSDNTASAMMFLGFGSLGEAGAGLKRIGSNLLAKKLTANTLAIGGKPLQEAITNQASYELTQQALKPVDNLEDFKDLITKLREEDETKFNLIAAEKGVLNSISIGQFGKTYGQLSPAEKAATRIVRAQQVKEAINEFPIHQPEIAKAQIESDVAKERQENPQLDARIKQLEQTFNIKYTDELANAEQEKLAEETGIKNPEFATTKVADVTKQTNIEDEEALAEAREVEPRKYYSLKQNSLAYFKNPRPKNSQFDYPKWLQDMSDEDFDREVRDHVGNSWYFENPEHLMLWAYQYKNEMPSAFKQRIIERLSELDPSGSPQSWSEAAKNQERHLDKLADTGKLFNERNVFRSSNFDTWGTRTKWQKQLNNQDLEKVEQLKLEKVLKPYLKNYSDKVKISMQALKKLQLLRRKAIDADEDLEFTNYIKQYPADLKEAFKYLKSQSR